MRKARKKIWKFAAAVSFAVCLACAGPVLPVPAAGEPLEGVMNALEQGGEKADRVTAAGIYKVIGIVPYIGAALFVTGVLVAVFSTRNKGNRRWGIRIAVTEAAVAYFIYVALTLVVDFAYRKCPVRHAERPWNAAGSDRVYFDAVESLAEEGQGYLFLESGWLGNAAAAFRKVYAGSAGLFAFTSASLGILLLMVTRRDGSVKRLAAVGMIVAVPAALLVGYHFIV